MQPAPPITVPLPPTQSPATMNKTTSSRWADVVMAETSIAKSRNEAVKLRQNPSCIMQLDEVSASVDEVEFTNEELQEGFVNWKLTLIGCVIGTEISWSNMEGNESTSTDKKKWGISNLVPNTGGSQQDI